MEINVVNLMGESNASLEEKFEVDGNQLGFEDITFTSDPLKAHVVLQPLDKKLIGELSVECKLSIECSKCLEAFDYAIDLAQKVEYLIKPTEEELKAELDGWFVSEFNGETVKLDDDIRQMLIIDIPSFVECSDDCKGLCVKCGGNRNKQECDCGKDKVTPKGPLGAAIQEFMKDHKTE